MGRSTVLFGIGRPVGKHMISDSPDSAGSRTGSAVIGGFPQFSRGGVPTLSAYATKKYRSFVGAISHRTLDSGQARMSPTASASPSALDPPLRNGEQRGPRTPAKARETPRISAWRILHPPFMATKHPHLLGFLHTTQPLPPTLPPTASWKGRGGRPVRAWVQNRMERPRLARSRMLVLGPSQGAAVSAEMAANTRFPASVSVLMRGRILSANAVASARISADKNGLPRMSSLVLGRCWPSVAAAKCLASMRARRRRRSARALGSSWNSIKELTCALKDAQAADAYLPGWRPMRLQVSDMG